MPKNSLRSTQAVVPFGVGAIVDFPGQSLMAAGLDVWPDREDCTINDERLGRRLGVLYFRSPPSNSGEWHKRDYLPFVRFPLWHICSRCRAMRKAKWNEIHPPKCNSTIGKRFKPQPGKAKSFKCSELPERKKWRMTPVRFITVCENGHVDDFPWIEWAHSRPGMPLSEARICENPELRLNYTGKSGLLGLVLKCESCNAKARSLMGSSGINSLWGLKCSGKRPWLGPNGSDNCNLTIPPRTLQRGASNLYFPKIASSILIPPYSDKIREIIDDPKIWKTLGSGINDDGTLEDSRFEVIAELKNVSVEKLKDAALQKLKGINLPIDNESEEEYRFAEYQALLNSATESENEFVTVKQDLNKFEDHIGEYIDNIVLVEKLAETRVLTGFSRLNPPPYREYDPRDQSQLSLKEIPWLPAIRVYGEGIFITLNKSKINKWATSEVQQRYQSVIANHRRIYRLLGREPRILIPQFFLLHTISHMLIRRLGFDCGYGSSSLSERIYCWDKEGKEMSGILIYTAAGDSEGTMGGLVQLGKPGRFESIFIRSIYDSMLCSADPLCLESRGQGTDSLNRAACHACALLPETSCEEGNRFLDRVAITGSSHKIKGYFGDIVEKILKG